MNTYGLKLDHYGTEEVSFIEQELEKFWIENDGEFEFMDNYRLGRVGDAAEEAEYDEIARTGCCGSHDMVIGPSPGGHSYRYGFNHGH